MERERGGKREREIECVCVSERKKEMKRERNRVCGCVKERDGARYS